jgi:hypothetical protein
MNILNWNCQGLGQSSIVQELSALVRAKSPSLVFLMETHRSAQRVMNLEWRLGLQHFVGVDSVGHGGGLVLFWHESLVVQLLGMNHRFIDVTIKDVNSNSRYRITFVYGEPRAESCHVMWETLQHLRAISNLPWMVVGYFNETMWGLNIFWQTKGLNGGWMSLGMFSLFVIFMIWVLVDCHMLGIMVDREELMSRSSWIGPWQAQHGDIYSPMQRCIIYYHRGLITVRFWWSYGKMFGIREGREYLGTKLCGKEWNHYQLRLSGCGVPRLTRIIYAVLFKHLASCKPPFGTGASRILEW